MRCGQLLGLDFPSKTPGALRGAIFKCSCFVYKHLSKMRVDLLGLTPVPVVDAQPCFWAQLQAF